MYHILFLVFSLFFIIWLFDYFLIFYQFAKDRCIKDNILQVNALKTVIYIYICFSSTCIFRWPETLIYQELGSQNELEINIIVHVPVMLNCNIQIKTESSWQSFIHVHLVYWGLSYPICFENQSPDNYCFFKKKISPISLLFLHTCMHQNSIGLHDIHLFFMSDFV